MQAFEITPQEQHVGRKPRRRISSGMQSGDPEGSLPDTTLMTFREPVPAAELSYAQWFRTHVLKSRWAVWFAAFYFHWLLVLVLAVLIVHGPETLGRVVLNAVAAEPEQNEVLQNIEADAPLEFSKEELIPEPVAPAAQALAATEPVTDLQLADSVLDALLADLDQPDDSATPHHTAGEPTEASGAAAPSAPVHAVTEGSFAVWTEPARPQPGDPYRIIIQIRLPEGTRVYPLTDLQGVVVGSDGYRKPIPGSVRGMLPVEGRHVRIIVHVVSADARVEDTIFVRSRMLRESQKLMIRF